MRIWLTRHKRWGSPVYLAGESYGTTRGAALADKLQSAGVALSGLILISCAMDLQSIVFAPANDLPYSLFLPAFANVSQYHGLLKGALAKSPAAARAAAEAFVDEEYVAPRCRPARASTASTNGRVAPTKIAEADGAAAGAGRGKEPSHRRNDLLLRGASSARAHRRPPRCARLRPMAASRTREWEFDPGIEAIASPYTMAAMAYFGEQLGMSTETRYEVLSMDVHKGWNWNRGENKGNSYATTSPDLARALRRNPHLKVFVGSPVTTRDALQRDRLVAGAARRTSRRAGSPHPAPLLRRKPHDVRGRKKAQLKADVAAWLEA